MRNYNKLAIDYIKTYAQERQDSAKAFIRHVCTMSDIDDGQLEQLKELIRTKARLGVHFHPYRLNKDLKTVLELLVDDGMYKNQFETQLSNGSLTAYKGGKRDVWENTLFGQIYENHEVPLSDHPKYGALDLLQHSDGPSPRFGSCFLVLKPHLTNYTTFSYLDSYSNPKEKGTIQYFDELLASLLVECFERSYAIGEKKIRPHQLVKKIIDCLNSTDQSYKRTPKRNLNHYIEAQIHTPIDLKKDVDLLVVDACYKRTEFESLLHQLSEKYAVELKWNLGFELLASEVPPHFRGNKMPELAKKIAEKGKINAYVLGKMEQKYRAERMDENILNGKLQYLKYLWHILVQYGKTIEKP